MPVRSSPRSSQNKARILLPPLSSSAKLAILIAAVAHKPFILALDLEATNVASDPITAFCDV